MNNQVHKDINWINALRAVCILFVFLRHCENYYGKDFGWFDGLYLPFYVNAFYFVSGYLLFWKQLSLPRIGEARKEYISGGGKTLLANVLFRIVLPSILFASIEFFPKKIIKGEHITTTGFLIETFGGCTYWFTSALALAEIIFTLLLLTRKQNIWFYALFAVSISALGGYMFQTNYSIFDDYVSFPWQYKHGFICMCYLALGGVYWRYEALIRKALNHGLVIILAVLYVFGSIYFRTYLAEGYMTSMGRIHPTGVLWSLFACILVVETCRILPKMSILTFIGRNSIGFYFMSGALPIIVSILAHKLFPETHSWVVLPVFVCCVIVAFFAMKILTRWLPWVFDFRLLNKHTYNV